MRYAEIAVAACAIGTSSPSLSQTEQGAPPIRGLFYVIGNEHVGTSEELIIVAASGTRIQNGNLARMTTMIFRAHPKRVANVDIGRFDSTVEYECRSGSSRTIQIAVRNPDNRLAQVLPPEATGFSSPSPQDQVTPKAAAIACGGAAPPTLPVMLTITDVERNIQRYRQSLGR